MDTVHVKPIEFKVVVAGPFDVGKTTLISNISAVPIVGTEVPTTGDEALAKQTTTVGLEYGRYTVTSDEFAISLLLYGTPGQHRFRFMWDTVSIGADGFIVLIDASRPETWGDVAEAIDYFGSRHGAVTVVGANRCEPQSASHRQVSDWVAQRGAIPVIACDVIDQRSSQDLMVALLDRLIGDVPDHAPEPLTPTVTA